MIQFLRNSTGFGFVTFYVFLFLETYIYMPHPQLPLWSDMTEIRIDRKKERLMRYLKDFLWCWRIVSDVCCNPYLSTFNDCICALSFLKHRFCLYKIALVFDIFARVTYALSYIDALYSEIAMGQHTCLYRIFLARPIAKT